MNKNIKAEEFLDDICYLAKRRKNDIEIVEALTYKYEGSRETLDKFFLEKFHMTLTLYIKKMRLICAYEYWRANGCKSISERESVFWIPLFKRKFIYSFNCTPEEANNKNIDLKSLLPNGEIYKLVCSCQSVGDFKVEKEGIRIDFNRFEILFLCLKKAFMYVMPIEMWEWLCSIKDPIERETRIIQHFRFIEFLGGNYDSLMRYYAEVNKEDKEQLELYDFDNPIILGGGVYFPLRFFDELGLFLEFKCAINDIIPYFHVSVSQMEMGFMDDLFLFEYDDWKKHESTVKMSIETLAEHLKISIEETLNEFWIHIKAGLLDFEEERCPEAVYSKYSNLYEKYNRMLGFEKGLIRWAI